MMQVSHEMFRRRVIILSGKGGVGKSTVAAALASLAAREGKRTLVVELAGQTAMTTLLGGAPGNYEEVERRPNLFTLSVTPEQSMQEYLIRELHSKRLYQLLFKNHYVAPFIAAVPGLEDLVSIGKVMDLERAVDRRGHPRWDLIVVDAPATGQGLNLLRVPRAMMEMTRMGPFYQNTKLIYDLLIDPTRTLLNLVTIPEEMPVNETIEMHRMVRRDIGVPQGYLIINNCRGELFTPSEQALLAKVASIGPAPDATHPRVAGAVLRTGLELNRRAQLEQAYVTRLQAEIALPTLKLPLLPRRNIGPQEINYLAEQLADKMAEHRLSGGAS